MKRPKKSDFNHLRTKGDITHYSIAQDAYIDWVEKQWADTHNAANKSHINRYSG